MASVDRLASTSRTLLDPTLPLRLEVLVERLLARRGLVLIFAILPLEAMGLLLASQHFLDKRPLALLVLDAAGEVFCGTLDDSSNLAVLGCLHLAVLFLVVAVGIKHTTHLEELQVALEFWREIGLGQVEPFVAGSSFFLLYNKSVEAPGRSPVTSVLRMWCLRVTMNKSSQVVQKGNQNGARNPLKIMVWDNFHHWVCARRIDLNVPLQRASSQ